MEELLEKYASLVIKKGIQIKKGQTVLIQSDIKVAPLVEKLTRIAYEEGAANVIQDWRYEQTSVLTFKMAEDSLFDSFSPVKKALYDDILTKDYCLINITSEDPDGFKGVDPSRLMRMQKAAAKPTEAFRKNLMADKQPWCIVGAASPQWAKKVFPHDKEDVAVAKLWHAIFETTRVHLDDPIEAWNQHQQALMNRSKYLNEQRFVKLHYTNGLGTDLTIELPEHHLWAGGSSKTPSGQTFMPNMPTEEVFTLPKKEGVHGVVYSTMPLVYQSKLIDGFKLEFKDGKVVAFDAKEGIDVLTSLLHVDEGASYLGEVALVPYESPISLSNTLFYNTLYDENASCHLALGEAYPLFEDIDNIDEQTMIERGLNKSLIHVDFMIGSQDLKIVGYKKDGSCETIIEQGRFVFER